jgi:hypothetical protein
VVINSKSFDESIVMLSVSEGHELRGSGVIKGFVIETGLVSHKWSQHDVLRCRGYEISNVLYGKWRPDRRTRPTGARVTCKTSK